MIAKKILSIMTKIGPVIKDKTNEEKGFDYASLAAIIIKAREAMIEEKIIMYPLKTEQIVQRGNDITISMLYRFYDTEPNEKNENEFFDINVPGEGCDSEGWAVYKALSGAYKYAITQTFAIPTIDDAEKGKYMDDQNNTEIGDNQNVITENDELNESVVESILGEPKVEDFERVFALN